VKLTTFHFSYLHKYPLCSK